MKLSAIIPTKNRFNDLVITLDGIGQNDVLPSEVIIIDQSPENRENDLLELLAEKDCNINIKYIHKLDVKSVLEARDYGFRMSSGDLKNIRRRVFVSTEYFPLVVRGNGLANQSPRSLTVAGS